MNLQTAIGILLTSLMLSGCGPIKTPRYQAYSEWESDCPDHVTMKLKEAANIYERLYEGDIDVLICEIRNMDISRTPLSDADIQAQRRLYGEILIHPSNSLDYLLMRYRYVLWHITGEGWDELEQLASEMNKDDIDDAMRFHDFYPAIHISRHVGPCGKIAREDPKYALIELGTGDHTPIDCPSSWDDVPDE